MREFVIGYIMGLVVVREDLSLRIGGSPIFKVNLYPRDPFPQYGWLLRGLRSKPPVSKFRADLPESWMREQFERWL